MSTLAARDLTVAFGKTTVLDGVDVSFAQNSFTGLIGANGAGKTTLLRTLIGAQAPTRGRIEWNGGNVAAFERRELAKRIAYLPQGGVCHWPLTVERLVWLGRLPHQSPWQRAGEADRRAVETALRETELMDLRDRTVTTLSGGERTRALLARALATEPDILLADEPVAALDPYHQLHVMTMLKAMAGRGHGVVVVLHDLTLAARYCDRLVLLAGGRIIGDGTPDTVLTADNLAAAYRVEAVRGTESGEPYILPWRYLERGAVPPTPPEGP